jgi:hypothetical protein
MLVMGVTALICAPYSGAIRLIWAATDAAIRDYVLYPWLQPQF